MVVVVLVVVVLVVVVVVVAQTLSHSYSRQPAWDLRHVRMPYADLSGHGIKRWSTIVDQLNNIRRTVSDINKFDRLKVISVSRFFEGFLAWKLAIGNF